MLHLKTVGQLSVCNVVGLYFLLTLFTPPLNRTKPAPLWTERPELCGFMSVRVKHEELPLSPVRGHSCPVKPVQRHLQVTEYNTGTVKAAQEVNMQTACRDVQLASD